MNSIIEVNGLSRSFGNVTAIDGVSFKVNEGKIYGLLGRNGAGKTTIMHMITGQQFATRGEIKVFGESPIENHKVLSQICFVKESQKYPDNYRVIDVLEVSASLFSNWDREFALSLADDFRLPLNRRVKKLSRGMLSSVGIIVGLASRAPLTIFDEPYLGLDAVSRSLFYDRLLEDYAEHPRTVVLSTHLIDEVSRMLEHVLVIDRGKLILDADADTLRGKAFAVAGKASEVDAYLAGKTIIHRELLGGLVAATVMCDGDGYSERKKAQAMGFELVPVSLQQLIVHLTRGSSVHKEAAAL